MADFTIRHISLSLYNYLCQNIVGSEVYVKNIRMMNNTRDNLTSVHNNTVTSGSFGEGLDLRDSDVDIMIVMKEIIVSEETNSTFRQTYRQTYFVMDTDEVYPGYTRLRLEHTNSFKYFVMCEELNDNYYLSSRLFLKFILSSQIDANIIHGPCVSSETGLFDYAYCLHSKLWVMSARNWITRSNSLWPSYDLKQCIVNHGVMFVPIGVKDSPIEELEWRMSFSVGEKLLIYSFTHTQLLCYFLMKLLLKDVINAFLDVKFRHLLCSYFLKTILFWISEELPPSIWSPENLINCFMRCFRRLIYCVKYSVCPHFFIPQNNLFENKIVGYSRQILLNNILSLESYGWQCILLSEKLSNLPIRGFYIVSDMSISDSKKFMNSKIIESDAAVMESFSRRGFRNFLRRDKIALQQLLSYENTKIKYVFRHYMSMICTQKAQLIPLQCTFENKYYYKQYKGCQYELLLNIYHDSISGWLMFASFFYRTKQYIKAMNVLSNGIYFKLYPHLDLEYYNLNFYCVKTFRTNFFPLMKMIQTNGVFFHSKSTLIPEELQMEVEYMPLCVPPTTYTLFLRFLCHYHLNNSRESRDSLRDLQMTVTKSYRIHDSTAKAWSFVCLGIAFQRYGDDEPAKKAFKQAYELESRGVKKVALKRLTLLK